MPTRLRDGYRCLNCEHFSVSTYYDCGAPGCGFKVGRFRTDYEEVYEAEPPMSQSKQLQLAMALGLLAAIVVIAYSVS